MDIISSSSGGPDLGHVREDVQQAINRAVELATQVKGLIQEHDEHIVPRSADGARRVQGNQRATERAAPASCLGSLVSLIAYITWMR